MRGARPAAAKIHIEEQDCGVEMAKEDSSNVGEEQHKTTENVMYTKLIATEPNITNTKSGRDSKHP